MTRVSRRPLIAIFVVVVAALSGCATAPAAPLPTMAVPPAHERPATAEPDPLVVEARERLAGLTLEQKIAGMLVLHLPGTDAAAIGAQAAALAPAGIILMGDNTAAGPDGIRAITAAVSPDPALPLLVAVDQEGGEVSRIDADPAPGAQALRGEDAAATGSAFAARGDLLRELGISVNFGIVADVTADPSSFLFGRVLGTDTASSAARVAAAVAGENGRVLSTLKHFPGHGAAPGDSHSSLPVATEDLNAWAATDAPPFQAGIGAGADLVMFGHLAYPALDSAPASLSRAWHDQLRNRLGFTGLTITDDMGMLLHAGDPALADVAADAVAAVAAGNDLLLYVPVPGDGFDPNAVIAAVASAVRAGSIPQSVIDDAVLRILTSRLSLGAVQ